MKKPFSTLVTEDALFVFLKKKNDGYEAYVNYKAMIKALKAIDVDVTPVAAEHTEALIELLEYLKANT